MAWELALHRFLATDDARHIIGQLMHVNGGDELA